MDTRDYVDLLLVTLSILSVFLQINQEFIIFLKVIQD